MENGFYGWPLGGIAGGIPQINALVQATAEDRGRLYLVTSYDSIPMLEASITHYYPLNESVTTIRDAIGSINAVASGGVTQSQTMGMTDGSVGIKLNGSTNKVDFASVLPGGNGAGSMDCWIVTPTSFPVPFSYILHNGSNAGATANGFGLYIDSSGNMGFDNTGTSAATVATSLSTSTLYHLCWTWTAEMLCTCYVNGVAIGTCTPTGTRSPAPANSASIGYYPFSGGSFFFNGTIAKVGWYSAILTADQVLEHFKAGINDSLFLGVKNGINSYGFVRADGANIAVLAPIVVPMPATVYAPTTTTSYTDTGEILVLVDASAGDVTITVPTASSRTAPVTVRRTDGSQNLCKVKPHTGENFDADAIGYFLISLGASVKLVPSSSSSYATANADGVWASGNAIAMPRLFAWWRADKGVISSGGAVSQWSDQSGNSNHVTQSTAANRPTVVSAQLNGLPVVRFTGTNSQYFDMFSWLGGQAFSFLIVAKSSGTGCGYDSILRWQVTTTYLVYPWNNGNGAAANQLILSTDGGTGGPSAGFLNNQWNIGYCSYAINRNATGFVTAQTGTTIATATSATTLLPKGMPGWMGGYVAANAEYTTADVAEIMIFFEDALSNASWRALVQIMRERWGL